MFSISDYMELKNAGFSAEDIKEYRAGLEEQPEDKGKEQPEDKGNEQPEDKGKEQFDPTKAQYDTLVQTIKDLKQKLQDKTIMGAEKKTDDTVDVEMLAMSLINPAVLREEK